MRHDKTTMNAQRKWLAIMGFLLPILSTILGFIGGDRNAPDFWWSLSAQYYSTARDIMVGTLFTFACFLFVYMGEDLGDKATCRFSAAMAFGILIFPCKTSAAGPTTGILNLPTDVSHIIHCIVAMLLFGSFAYMIGFRFTKTDCITRNREKVVRDWIYTLCSDIIILFMVVQVLTSVAGIGWMTIVNETIMLWAFSFAWAVKAGIFKKFNDKN